MKSKLVAFSALLCAFSVSAAVASDCLWDDCYLDAAPVKTKMQKPVALPEPVMTSEKTVSVKALSIKPVPSDDRPVIWDGTNKNYEQRAFDKTVDWRTGVPVWDDSISDYTKKDFGDWLTQPAPVVYFADSAPAMDIMPISEEIAEIRSRVEELLIPIKPTDSLWTTDKYMAQDLGDIVFETFGTAIENPDGCPFETEFECDIWRRKPMVRETVSPRSPKLRAVKMDAFIDAACMNPDINASAPVAAPLLERYQMLMKSSNACCTDGMAYQLKSAGASRGLVYKFLADDANFYQFGSRCLMMTDAEFDIKYPNTATVAVVADVRNGCLCRGRQWFTAMLAPFVDAYAASPEFADARFDYTYVDGLGRETTVSINNDVQNVLKQLEMCP